MDLVTKVGEEIMWIQRRLDQFGADVEAPVFRDADRSQGVDVVFQGGVWVYLVSVFPWQFVFQRLWAPSGFFVRVVVLVGSRVSYFLRHVL